MRRCSLDPCCGIKRFRQPVFMTYKQNTEVLLHFSNNSRTLNDAKTTYSCFFHYVGNNDKLKMYLNPAWVWPPPLHTIVASFGCRLKPWYRPWSSWSWWVLKKASVTFFSLRGQKVSSLHQVLFFPTLIIVDCIHH